MKNKKTNTGLFRLFLGIFLSVLSVAVTHAVGPCDSFKNNEACASLGETCHWVTSSEGEGGECKVSWARCNDVNVATAGDEKATALVESECADLGCWWDASAKKCGKAADSCESRSWTGCTFDSDCRWNNGVCMFRSEKKSIQAVEQVKDFCFCLTANGDLNVRDSSDCVSTKNKYWKEEIPSTCNRPLTNEAVRQFCEGNASLLSDAGKSSCNKAIKYVLKGGEQECLDLSERAYQSSLKSAEDRSDRRMRDDLCRAQSEEFYPGAVFSGGGLRAGALESHKQLTKSISHETDLKVLVLGWMAFALELTAVIAVVALVYAGILYVTDLGDGGNQEKAKKIIMWVAIGILVILGSYAIVNTLMKADLGNEERASISTTYLS